MIFRNIDLVNSLIPVCTEINKQIYENFICSECNANSSVDSPSDKNSAADIFLKLAKVCTLLEKVSPEYIRRFEDYEIDLEYLMYDIDYILQSPKEFWIDYDLIYEQMGDLLEMCVAEIEQYLLMTHPADHNDLSLFTIKKDGGDNIGLGIICRTAATGD